MAEASTRLRPLSLAVTLGLPTPGVSARKPLAVGGSSDTKWMEAGDRGRPAETEDLLFTFRPLSRPY